MVSWSWGWGLWLCGPSAPSFYLTRTLSLVTLIGMPRRKKIPADIPEVPSGEELLKLAEGLMQPVPASERPDPSPIQPEPASPAEEPPEPVKPIVLGTPKDARPARRASVPYSEELAQRIADLYTEGMPLTQICKIEGLPTYTTVSAWVKKHAVFREMLEAGRVARAVHFEEKALEAAEMPTGKDDVPQARLLYDAAVWAASVNDPVRYGKRTVVSGDPDSPLQLVVVTGVPEPAEDQKEVILTQDGRILDAPKE